MFSTSKYLPKKVEMTWLTFKLDYRHDLLLTSNIKSVKSLNTLMPGSITYTPNIYAT